ncbi:MAG: hypothetical protein H0W94_00520 [Actinobacteria bacterium]|nr:hypothetical protein [Actinomycetota bacterium]
METLLVVCALAWFAALALVLAVLRSGALRDEREERWLRELRGEEGKRRHPHVVRHPSTGLLPTIIGRGPDKKGNGPSRAVT